MISPYQEILSYDADVALKISRSNVRECCEMFSWKISCRSIMLNITVNERGHEVHRL